MPYIKGNKVLLCCIANMGSKEPKNSTADVGQKDNANNPPKVNAPKAPEEDSRLCRLFEILSEGLEKRPSLVAQTLPAA